jgi:ectoine hydroxylase-related dioxygenase (phytanoyl-CoA dioxygenase family)
LRRRIPAADLHPAREWAAGVADRAPAVWSELTVSSNDRAGAPPSVTTLATRVCEVVAATCSRRFAARGWTLIVKAPRTGAATRWHQDEAYLGGRPPYELVTAWLPLTDVDERSGCLRYVPLRQGYGLLPHATVPETTSDPIPTLATDPGDDLIDASVSCPMAAGDVLLHLPQVLHASHDNLAPEPRFAFVVDLVTPRWR